MPVRDQITLSVVVIIWFQACLTPVVNVASTPVDAQKMKIKSLSFSDPQGLESSFHTFSNY